MSIELIFNELKTASQVLNQFTENPVQIENIEKASSLMTNALKRGGKIVSCGNGGSMCDAMHFAEELTARYRQNRPALAAISISDPAYLSCAVNDFGPEEAFSRYLEAILLPGDVILAISTSGNSVNVLNAARTAREKEVSIISLTGNRGGKLKGVSDINIDVPFDGYADRIQEVHIKIIHILIFLIEKKIYN
jgi:D-sedoheptulose 7-phosphate isomerase